MSYNNQDVHLGDVCEIRFGLQTSPSLQGTVPYLQLQHFNTIGQLIETPNDLIDVDKNSESHILQEGDVLFVGKGSRLFAWQYHSTMGPLVASSTFFVLRAHKSKILPSFLTTLLNSLPFKARLQQIGAGTNIFSIRKSELGSMRISLPQLEQQKRISELANIYLQDINLTKEILSCKEHLFTSIISKLMINGNY